MHVFAYCGLSFAKATEKVAGLVPLTSPPLTTYKFDPRWLEGHDLLIFDLHGLPELDYWFEEVHEPYPTRINALTADQIREADLGGAVVFALNCYLGNQDSPMLDALLDSGASYVIGGDGLNWSGTSVKLLGAGQLAYYFRKLLEDGVDPVAALVKAKTKLERWLIIDQLLNREQRVMAAKDTLEFKAFYRRSNKDESKPA